MTFYEASDIYIFQSIGDAVDPFSTPYFGPYVKKVPTSPNFSLFLHHVLIPFVDEYHEPPFYQVSTKSEEVK